MCSLSCILLFLSEFNFQIPSYDLFELNGLTFSIQTPEVSQLLDAQAGPTWASLVAIVTVVTATIIAALLAVRRKVLHEGALGEVMPIGVMELAPHSPVLAGRGRLLLAAGRVSSGRRLRVPFCSQDGGSLPIVRLDAGLGRRAQEAPRGRLGVQP